MRAKHMKNQNEKKQVRTLNVVLIILGILVVAFVVTMILIYLKTGGIPDTLCGCFFTAATSEFGEMGWIRTTKDRDKKRQYDLEDREYNDSKSKNKEEPY
jgi:hypothetical protein